jgi:hypothetical protein
VMSACAFITLRVQRSTDQNFQACTFHSSQRDRHLRWLASEEAD